MFPGRSTRPPEPEPAPPVAAPGPTKETLWRQEQLEKAGFDEVQAALIASDKTIDLHRAVGLATDAGTALAIRILL